MFVYCVHHRVLVEEWFRGGHTCSFHMKYDKQLASSASLTWIEDQIMIWYYVLVCNLWVAQQIFWISLVQHMCKCQA